MLLEIDDKYKKLIPPDNLDKIKKGIENSNSIECQNFEDIYNNIISKGIPLTRENLKKVKTYGLVQRLKFMASGQIQMSEEEFDILCNDC